MEKDITGRSPHSNDAERLAFWTLHRIARSPASIGELTNGVTALRERRRPQDSAALLDPLIRRMVDRGFARMVPDPCGESARDAYSITPKGLRQLETMVHCRLPRRPASPKASLIGGSPLEEVPSPLELSRMRIQVVRELLGARGAEASPTQKESALRAYTVATERELSLTAQLLRERGPPAARSRNRFR